MQKKPSLGTGSTRLQYLDAVKAVGISLIVLSHIFGSMGLGSNAIWRWINVFMVGIFFALSGYMAALFPAKGEITFCQFFAKKWNALMLPFIWFSLAALTMKLAVAWTIGGSLMEQIIPAAIEFFGLMGTGVLWFLPALFVAELGFFWVRRLPLAGRLAVLLLSYGSTFAALPAITGCHALFVVFRGMLGLGLMIVGYDGILILERKLSRTGLLALMALCAAVTVGAPFFLSMDFRTLDFYGNPIWVFVSTWAATTGTVQFFQMLEHVMPLEPIARIGRDSLIIMCTHNEWFLVPIFHTGLTGIIGPCANIGLRYYLECGVILILILLTERGIADAITGIKKVWKEICHAGKFE